MIAMGTKAVQSPGVERFIVSKNVEISVVCHDAKVRRVRRVPSIVDFAHFEEPVKNREALRALADLVTCIALDANIHLAGYWISADFVVTP